MLILQLDGVASEVPPVQSEMKAREVEIEEMTSSARVFFSLGKQIGDLPTPTMCCAK